LKKLVLKKRRLWPALFLCGVAPESGPARPQKPPPAEQVLRLCVMEWDGAEVFIPARRNGSLAARGGGYVFENAPRAAAPFLFSACFFRAARGQGPVKICIFKGASGNLTNRLIN
jgi:hypothetical protein